MGKISLQDLASVLVERWRLGKKETSMFVNEMFFLIQKTLDEEKIVKVKGLGTFKIIDVDDRESVDVNTGDRVLIEGHGKITFTPDTLMKELVNKPFSQFETVVLNDGVDFNETPVNQSEEGETSILEETEDSAAPLVEFVDESQIEKPVELEMPEPPEVQEKTNESEMIVEQEPSKTEPVAETVETSDEHEESDVLDDFEEESGFKKYLKWIGIVLLILAVFLIGYLAGRGPKTTSQEPKTVVVEKDTIKSMPKDSTTTKIDTDVEDEPLEDDDEITEDDEEVVEEDAQAQGERPLDKWEAMDVRVRTGAYRIVGTDTVVKAKAGDNLTRISKRFFGPGMECYLAVYNGLSVRAVLSAGQEIKIPKLELKKKRRK